MQHEDIASRDIPINWGKYNPNDPNEPKHRNHRHLPTRFRPFPNPRMRQQQQGQKNQQNAKSIDPVTPFDQFLGQSVRFTLFQRHVFHIPRSETTTSSKLHVQVPETWLFAT